MTKVWKNQREYRDQQEREREKKSVTYKVLSSPNISLIDLNVEARNQDRVEAGRVATWHKDGHVVNQLWTEVENDKKRWPGTDSRKKKELQLYKCRRSCAHSTHTDFLCTASHWLWLLFYFSIPASFSQTFFFSPSLSLCRNDRMKWAFGRIENTPWLDCAVRVHAQRATRTRNGSLDAIQKRWYLHWQISTLSTEC